MSYNFINKQVIADLPKLMTGKDGGLFNGEGKLLASVEQFKATLNQNNAKAVSIGNPQEHEVPATYAVTLSFTEFVVEDSTFFKDLMEGVRTGIMPTWNFQGLLRNKMGREERIIYRQCIPTGAMDLQNVTNTGDIIKREVNLFVNEPPDLQSFL